MGLSADLAAFEARLDLAIEDALRNEVSEVIKNYIVDSAYDNVYEAYTPEFWSRRYGNGGLLDKKSIEVLVSGRELIAQDNPKWQQLWGGDIPTEALVDAITEGNPRFNMGKAGPRPFHEAAKDATIDSGEVGRALLRGLERQGFKTTEISFRFL